MTNRLKEKSEMCIKANKHNKFKKLTNKQKKQQHTHTQ